MVAEMYGVCCACCASVALTNLGPQNVFTNFFLIGREGKEREGYCVAFFSLLTSFLNGWPHLVV